MNPISLFSETKERNVRTLDSLLNLYDGMTRDFMARSFYLPKEIMQAVGWDIEPIKVCTGEEFAEFWDYYNRKPINQSAQISLEGATSEMLKHAKFVGISVRINKMTKRTYLVCKLWYGTSSKTDNTSEKVAA